VTEVILVVDDDPDVLDVAAKLIESFGYVAKVADNAAMPSKPSGNLRDRISGPVRG